MRSNLRFLWLLLPLAVLIFIFFNAFTPGVESNGFTSSFLDSVPGRGISDLLALITGETQEEATVFSFARGAAHVAEYLLLGIFSYLALRNIMEYIPNAAYLLFAGTLTAIADEAVQCFIPGRTAQVTDILLDMGSFALAILVCLLMDRLFCGVWVTEQYRKKYHFWR